jgi:hypothetical protein
LLAGVSVARRAGVVLAAAAVLTGVSAHPVRAATAQLEHAPAPETWRDASTQGFQPLRSLHLDLRPAKATRVARGSWWGGPVVTSTGETVTLYVSDSFGPDEARRASWANFFAGLYHGSELATIRIYQATLAEVGQLCGPDAAGCYSGAARLLVFPGDLDPAIDADIGAHEYGHHVAASRRNDPWDALDWGPKRWATYVGVCARAAAATVFPGDEGDHYTLNTGEAFAEAYRVLNIQRGGTWANIPLVVDASLAPDATSLSAALTDVQQPWVAPTEFAWDGRFGEPQPPVTKLAAAVGPGAVISLTTAAGSRVRSLRAGVYAITVRDGSTKDNFHLTGGATVSRRTSVTGRGTVVWKLALGAGAYRFRSDAHPALAGSFAITDAALRIGSSRQAFAPQDRAIPTPLDGDFQATVTGVAGATLELIDAASGQDLVPAAPGQISYTVCGQRSVLLRIAGTQEGSFRVSLTAP